MSITALGRPNPLAKLTTVCFSLAFLALAASDAPAQLFEKRREYYRCFYGQDFYDGQGHGPRYGFHSGFHQYRGPVYGPAQMYGRQYGQENGYNAAPPFVLPRREPVGPGFNDPTTY